MLSILDRLLALVEKTVRVISLRRIVIWSLAALVIIISVTVFEYRNEILAAIFEPSAPTHYSALQAPSTGIKQRIKSFVDREDSVVGVAMLSVDIRNNMRLPVYWYSDDQAVQKLLDAQFAGRISGIPLFTSDDKNNTVVISAINAEFRCDTFVSSGAGIVFPEFGARVPSLCHTSIPPFFGHFTGYITLLLSREPATFDKDILKAETITLSNEIYTKDILPYINN